MLAAAAAGKLAAKAKRYTAQKRDGGMHWENVLQLRVPVLFYTRLKYVCW